MKLLAALSVVFASFWVTVPGEQVPERDTRQTQSVAGSVALQWARALFSGDVEVAMALCEVPFAWDRKKVITNSAELREMFKGVVGDKGAREAPAMEVTKVVPVSEIEDELFPKSYFTVDLAVAGERIRVAVGRGDVMRVIGFSD